MIAAMEKFLKYAYFVLVPVLGGSTVYAVATDGNTYAVTIAVTTFLLFPAFWIVWGIYAAVYNLFGFNLPTAEVDLKGEYAPMRQRALVWVSIGFASVLAFLVERQAWPPGEKRSGGDAWRSLGHALGDPLLHDLRWILFVPINVLVIAMLSKGLAGPLARIILWRRRGRRLSLPSP